MNARRALARWFAPVLFGILALLTLGAAIWVVRKIYADRLVAIASATATPLVRAEPSSALPTLLLLGDSRMAEWGLPQLPGFRVVNAGFPGCTTSQIATQTRSLLNEIKPQVVVIQAGINDLKLLGVRRWARATVIDAALRNLLAIVEQSQRHGARVIVTSVWPVGPLTPIRRIFWSSEVESARRELNRRLETLCAERRNILVIDLLAPVAPVQRAALYRDTLHLKPQAYAQFTITLQGVLARERVERLPPSPSFGGPGKR
jgi:lysophospholipase L1-like esterase